MHNSAILQKIIQRNWHALDCISRFGRSYFGYCTHEIRWPLKTLLWSRVYRLSADCEVGWNNKTINFRVSYNTWCMIQYFVFLRKENFKFIQITLSYLMYLPIKYDNLSSLLWFTCNLLLIFFQNRLIESDVRQSLR